MFTLFIFCCVFVGVDDEGNSGCDERYSRDGFDHIPRNNEVEKDSIDVQSDHRNNDGFCSVCLALVAQLLEGIPVNTAMFHQRSDEPMQVPGRGASVVERVVADANNWRFSGRSGNETSATTVRYE